MNNARVILQKLFFMGFLLCTYDGPSYPSFRNWTLRRMRFPLLRWRLLKTNSTRISAAFTIISCLNPPLAPPFQTVGSYGMDLGQFEPTPASTDPLFAREGDIGFACNSSPAPREVPWVSLFRTFRDWNLE